MWREDVGELANLAGVCTESAHFRNYTQKKCQHREKKSCSTPCLEKQEFAKIISKIGNRKIAKEKKTVWTSDKVFLKLISNTNPSNLHVKVE